MYQLTAPNFPSHLTRCFSGARCSGRQGIAGVADSTCDGASATIYSYLRLAYITAAAINGHLSLSVLDAADSSRQYEVGSNEPEAQSNIWPIDYWNRR